MASRVCQTSVAQSKLPDKANRSRRGHGIELSSGIGVLGPTQAQTLACALDDLLQILSDGGAISRAESDRESHAGRQPG